jgi:hypothetical protein
MSSFTIRAEFVASIHWNTRGSCGESGCTDPECCCSICARPIGVAETDPRWDDHEEYCGDCDLCRDQVPIMLFRGEGKHTQQAQFHQRCFERIIEIPEPPEGVKQKGLKT